MTGVDTHNDATDDHEQFEAELLAQDCDAAHIVTADIDDRTARRLVNELVDNDVVVPVPDERLLVHDPTGKAFDSVTQLAVFHRGWTVGRNADERAE